MEKKSPKTTVGIRLKWLIPHPRLVPSGHRPASSGLCIPHTGNAVSYYSDGSVSPSRKCRSVRNARMPLDIHELFTFRDMPHI